MRIVQDIHRVVMVHPANDDAKACGCRCFCRSRRRPTIGSFSSDMPWRLIERVVGSTKWLRLRCSACLLLILSSFPERFVIGTHSGGRTFFLLTFSQKSSL